MKIGAKTRIIGAIIIIAAVIVIIYATPNKPNPLQEKIDELKSLGYNIQECSESWQEIRTRREQEGVVWEQTLDWNIFLQQVEAVKENLGFVTVWVCRDANILWIHATETTYYYYVAS